MLESEAFHPWCLFIITVLLLKMPKKYNAGSGFYWPRIKATQQTIQNSDVS